MPFKSYLIGDLATSSFCLCKQPLSMVMCPTPQHFPSPTANVGNSAGVRNAELKAVDDVTPRVQLQATA